MPCNKEPLSHSESFFIKILLVSLFVVVCIVFSLAGAMAGYFIGAGKTMPHEQGVNALNTIAGLLGGLIWIHRKNVSADYDPDRFRLKRPE